MASKEEQKKIVKQAEKLLSLIGVDAQASIEDAGGGYNVNINSSDESGLLIGNRGRTLQAVQHVLSMMINKDKKDWRRITVDVASWREKEKERLTSLALQTAERARSSKEPQNLYNLTPEQRRIVHLALSEEDDIATESQGEGKDRYLVVASKK